MVSTSFHWWYTFDICNLDCAVGDFAFSEYKGLSNLETGVLSGGMLLNFGLSVLLFNPFESLTSGLLFYSLFMVFLVGAIIVYRKLR